MEPPFPQNFSEDIHAVKSDCEVRMKGMLGILVVALISLLAYKYYFADARSDGAGTPAQTINIVGVKNDLLALAQAERGYQAEHGGFASLDDLTSSGALTMAGRLQSGRALSRRHESGLQRLLRGPDHGSPERAKIARHFAKYPHRSSEHCSKTPPGIPQKSKEHLNPCLRTSVGSSRS
jgi:hypothetical protein